MLTIGAAFYELKAALGALYDEGEASAIAHATMERITGLTKLQRLGQKGNVLEPERRAEFERLKASLSAGVPLQYVLGEAYFLGRKFEVSPAVLIPRPETEELVGWIVSSTPTGSILDIGTGSGCIAISLKLAQPQCAVNAIDISNEALNVARRNATALNADVNFRNCDFLKAELQQGLGVFNCIVSNPPYIPETERESLHTNVRDHEPGTALFVPGGKALLFYEAIARFAQQHLAPGGQVFCELHRDYAAATAALFKESGFRNVELRQDMHGNPRMLRAGHLQ